MLANHQGRSGESFWPESVPTPGGMHACISNAGCWSALYCRARRDGHGAGPGEGQGQGRLHRLADRRQLRQRPWRPQLRRSRSAAAQRRSEGQVRIRDGRARRRVQAECRRAAGDQARGRQGDHLGGDALLLGRCHRHGRRLPQVRPADHRVGRGAARHHLPQQVRRGAPRQRHHDQPEPAQRRAALRSSATRPSP